MSPLLLTLILFAIGLAVYGALVFWAGTRGYWWLAVLLSLPAAMGGVMRLITDVPAGASALARHFGWLVLIQLVIGFVVYRLGRARTANASSSTGNS